MALPKVDYPTFEVEIPSTKQKVTLRPMLVREEKILLTAKESDAPNGVFIAIKNVINNCCYTTPLDLSKLTTYDLEYLFLKIRSASVGNRVDLVFTDTEDDNKEHKFTVDLDTITIKYPKTPQNTLVKLNNDMNISLRYPLATVYESPVFMSKDSTPDELFDAFTLASLDKCWKGDVVTKFEDSSREEIKEFVDNLDIKTYDKIKEFVSDLPTLYYETKYKDSNGKEKTMKLTSLMDFFAFA